MGKGRYAGFYFVADFTNQDPLQQRFMDFLSHNGYVVRKKAVKTIKDDETGEVTYKSNVDADLAVDLLNTDKNYDVAYLFSRDSDYERVVDIPRSRADASTSYRLGNPFRGSSPTSPTSPYSASKKTARKSNETNRNPPPRMEITSRRP